MTSSIMGTSMLVNTIMGSLRDSVSISGPTGQPTPETLKMESKMDKANGVENLFPQV